MLDEHTKFLVVPLAISAAATYAFEFDGPMLLYGFAAGMLSSLVLFPRRAKKDEFMATFTATAPQLAAGTALGYFLSR